MVLHQFPIHVILILFLGRRIEDILCSQRFDILSRKRKKEKKKKKKHKHKKEDRKEDDNTRLGLQDFTICINIFQLPI